MSLLLSMLLGTALLGGLVISSDLAKSKDSFVLAALAGVCGSLMVWHVYYLVDSGSSDVLAMLGFYPAAVITAMVRR